jgi:hypothetical protein
MATPLGAFGETGGSATTDLPPNGTNSPEAQAVFRRESRVVNIGWVGTVLALQVMDLPRQFMLKDQLHFSASQVATFDLFGKTASYVKPFMGIMSDAVPLRGTRRYYYLLTSLSLGAAFFLAFGLVPRQWNFLLPTFMILFIWLNLASTVLGGLMVDLGKRYHATGRLSSQRQAISRGCEMVSGPLGGFLAKYADFAVTGIASAAIHMGLFLYARKNLQEPPLEDRRNDTLAELRLQARNLFSSRTLWAAAGLIILVVAAPGFNTPLLFFQTDVLKFDKAFIGLLKTVGAAAAVLAAWLYSQMCQRMHLRKLLAASIAFHAGMTLWYLLYRDPVSAMVITALESMTMVFALLPLYDLAARATPKGSEALGYSVMMSVWNFTIQMSDLAGSMLRDKLGLTFHDLIWVNAASTLLVLAAVPFLPSVLVDRRDGAEGAPAPGRAG